MTELTKNFTLEEMIRSTNASKMGFTEQFKPSKEVIENLTELCINVLQPLRTFIRQSIFVSSGYRCERLNNSIKGAKSSQHLTGEAADIQGTSQMSNKDLFQFVIMSKVPFDQLIIEFEDEFGEPGWIHISYSKSRQRGQILKAYKDQAGQTKYMDVTKQFK